LCLVSAETAACGGQAADRIDVPPIERQFRSLSGGFVLTVNAVDAWKTPFARATLRNAAGAVQWEKQLPHHHGPRRALVTAGGRVLLVDEWINVASKYALTLIARDGTTVAAYSAEQAITSHARFGPWRAAGPNLSADGRSADFSAGGKRLSLRLSDGRLTARG
jgi:hypothetical protein